MPLSTTPDVAAAAMPGRTAPAPRWIRIVAALFVAWNLIGLGMFLADAGVFGPAAVSPGVAAMPTLVFVAFGLSCITGVAGSIGLTLLRRWSRPVLWISAVALVIDWGWVLGFGSGGSVPLGVTVLAGAAVLVMLAEMAERRGWLV